MTVYSKGEGVADPMFIKTLKTCVQSDGLINEAIAVVNEVTYTSTLDFFGP